MEQEAMITCLTLTRRQKAIDPMVFTMGITVEQLTTMCCILFVACARAHMIIMMMFCVPAAMPM